MSNPYEPEQITDLMDDIEARVTTLDADRRAGKTLDHETMIQAYIDGAHLAQIIEGMQTVLDTHVNYLATIKDTLEDFDEFDQMSFAAAARHRVKTQENNDA